MTAPYRDERFNWRAAENVVVVLFLILFSEGLFQRLISPVASADGSPLLRQLWLPAYGFAIAMSAFHWRALLQICLRAPFLILLVLLTLASAAWSIDPGITLRRSVALICTTWFGLYLAARYTWPDLLRLFGWAWLIVAAANLIAALAAPGIAVDHATHAGAWMGLYPEKNALGGVMARASFLFGILLLADERHRKAWALGLALCVLLVLMSTSKTALLATILGAVAIGAGILVKRSAVLAIGTVWAGVMAVVAI
ncbi:MAG: hypothetical protein KDA53_18165, partial [Hyphomonas sp.]|nr:hypothetical protein [Hyphomonas sp.]